MNKFLGFAVSVMATGLLFSCTSDIESAEDILGNTDSSSSFLQSGLAPCRYATGCAEILADACISFGGTIVASCPASVSSSSFAGVSSSSSPFGVLSSSSLSNSSSSLQSGSVFCTSAIGCAEMPADACIAFGGEVVAFCPVSSSSSSLASSSSLFAVVSSSSGISDNSSSSNAVLISSSSSETPAVPSSSSVVPSSSSSAIPVVQSSSSAMPSSSSSGFYDLGNVVDMGEIGNAFEDIVNSYAEGSNCVYISFNWSQGWLQSLTLACDINEWTSLSEINRGNIGCFFNDRCSFDIINGTNVWNVCFNKRSSGSSPNCWTSN